MVAATPMVVTTGTTWVASQPTTYVAQASTGGGWGSKWDKLAGLTGKGK
jgi:hypothetical protein